MVLKAADNAQNVILNLPYQFRRFVEIEAQAELRQQAAGEAGQNGRRPRQPRLHRNIRCRRQVKRRGRRRVYFQRRQRGAGDIQVIAAKRQIIRRMQRLRLPGHGDRHLLAFGK